MVGVASQRNKGVWVVFYKGEKRTLSYDDIAEEALCFGWVDSKPGKVDEEKTKLYLAPRDPSSNWSVLNKKRIAELGAAGLVAEAGREMVKVAEENGTWDALNDVENLVIPKDLGRAFANYGEAEANFQAFPPSAQRGILEWIFNAKREATEGEAHRRNRSVGPKTSAGQPVVTLISSLRESAARMQSGI